MATGMIFAALAFGAATLVEISVVVRMNSNHKSRIYLEQREEAQITTPKLPTNKGGFMHIKISVGL